LALENRRVIGDLRLDSCPIMRARLRAEGAPRVPIGHAHVTTSLAFGGTTQCGGTRSGHGDALTPLSEKGICRPLGTSRLGISRCGAPKPHLVLRAVSQQVE
jgi:hypothetical protein